MLGPLTQRQSHQYHAQWATEEIPVAQYFSELTEKYGVADQQLADVIDVSRSLQNQNTVNGLKMCLFNSRGEMFVLHFC